MKRFLRRLLIDLRIRVAGLPACRVCGCTEITACVDPLGTRCCWVAPNLCSGCVE